MVVPHGGYVERLHPGEPVGRVGRDVGRAAVHVGERPAILRISDGEIPADILGGRAAVGLAGVGEEIAPHLRH